MGAKDRRLNNLQIKRETDFVILVEALIAINGSYIWLR